MDEFYGSRVVELTTGKVLNVIVVRVWRTVDGVPIVLVCQDGNQYNWQNIISIR